jgi:AraC family transcriptional regulator
MDDVTRAIECCDQRNDTPANHMAGPWTAERAGPASRRRGLPGCRLRRVLDHVREHLPDDLSVSALAAVAAMSPHHFSALFRKSMDVTPHRYVLLQRVQHAKQRLEDPRWSVLEAALDSGFENASHFARTFRRLVGTSPSAYRAAASSHRHVEKVVLPRRAAATQPLRAPLSHGL